MRSTSTRLISVVVLLLVAVSLATEAQVGKVPRIGVLLPGSPDPDYERRLDAFRQGLRELGYIDTQNILLEYRWAHARYEHMADLVAELLRLKVDVLVIDSTRAGLAAKRATSTLPIVLAVAGDPVGNGLVESLARPGGNITGMSLMSPELSAKRLELLKDMVPTAARMAVLLNPDNPLAQLHWRGLEGAAPRLHVQLQAVEVRRATDFERACSTMADWRADALLVIEDPALLPALQTEIVDCAARHRLPTMTGLRSLVDAGGLMSYGASFPALFRRAATFVVKILGGAKPSDLPVEQPTKFDLVLNLKTAKALGITPPPRLKRSVRLPPYRPFAVGNLASADSVSYDAHKWRRRNDAEKARAGRPPHRCPPHWVARWGTADDENPSAVLSCPLSPCGTAPRHGDGPDRL